MSEAKPEKLPEPPAGGREQRRRETRERIYQAALSEFREAGFQKAQIDRIVERAGVARGTFYFHFPTKEHVLLELQRRQEVAAAERIAASPRRAENLSDYLHQVTEVVASEAALANDEDPELTREMLAMYVRQPPDRLVQPSQEPLLVEMSDFFQECAERGELRDDFAPEELMGVFMRALFGWVAIRVERPEGADSLATFVDIFVRGVSR